MFPSMNQLLQNFSLSINAYSQKVYSIFMIYPQSMVFLGEISGHFGVQSHCLQELGPQGHHMGGQPGKILADLFSYLLWVVQHLQG